MGLLGNYMFFDSSAEALSARVTFSISVNERIKIKNLSMSKLLLKA